jgi:hypothetical protein
VERKRSALQNRANNKRIFSAKVNNATGIGKVKIVASSGKEQTVYETEIDVRNPNPYTTQVTEATLQAGSKLELNSCDDRRSAK